MPSTPLLTMLDVILRLHPAYGGGDESPSKPFSKPSTTTRVTIVFGRLAASRDGVAVPRLQTRPTLSIVRRPGTRIVRSERSVVARASPTTRAVSTGPLAIPPVKAGSK